MNPHTSIATTISLTVFALLLYVPATSSIRIVPAFAQLSPDCSNNGSNHVNAEVSKHSNTEGNQAQSQANQCAPPRCPTGNTGTATTEDESTDMASDEGSPGGEVSASGNCFPSGVIPEDEPSGSEESNAEG